MSAPLRPRATEERLYQIRQAASAAPAGPSPTGHPQIQGRDSYYGLPALKPPVWTWQVPLYFYFGGIAGVSAVMAFAAHLFGAEPAMIRLLLWMALVGAAVCPALLIADLGKPSRFLNMLRVFKVRSPMSMGAWILVAFSGFAFIALAARELGLSGVDSPLLVGLGWIGEALAAVTGLLLASYTGVLIGATAIPVWFSNRRILPPHFLTSGLGSSAGILELAGFLVPATQVLGFLAAGMETLFEVSFVVRRRTVDGPLHHGLSGDSLPRRRSSRGAGGAGDPPDLGLGSCRAVGGCDLLPARSAPESVRVDLGRAGVGEGSEDPIRRSAGRGSSALSSLAQAG